MEPAARWMRRVEAVRSRLRYVGPEVVRAFRERRIGWLARQALKFPLIRLATALDAAPLAGPIVARLVTTYRCNDHCTMCDLPARARVAGRKERPTSDWKRLIDELADEGTSSISIQGGEPLLRRDTPELIAWARRRGLPVSVNTNGLLFARPEVAAAVVDAGVSQVFVSFDTAVPAVYDSLRRRPGGWDGFVRGVEGLLEARRRLGARVGITAVAVWSPATLPAFPRTIAAAAALGFDSIGVNPLHLTTVQPGTPACRPGAAPSRDLLEGLLHQVEALARLGRGPDAGIAAENSDDYLRMLPLAFLGEPVPVPCRAGHVTSVVDPYGDVYPCWPWLEWGRGCAGNVADGGWARVWKSDRQAALRRETATCRDCFWNCQMELNLLFGRPTRDGLLELRRSLARPA